MSQTARPGPRDHHPLTVLSVAYPLAPVGRDVVGGAEQVQAMLDRALVRAGHVSLVVATAGSACTGQLIATPRPRGVLDDRARKQAQAHHRAAIRGVLARTRVDIVHMHGLDFDAYLPDPGPAVLATLHLPLAWYAPPALACSRPGTFLSCVSHSQLGLCPPDRAAGLTARLAGVVENGVDLRAFRPLEPGEPPMPGGAAAALQPGEYVLALGRICEEKGFHRALDAARRAGVAMLLAGEVYRYPEHEAYFRTRVKPLLDAERRFIGPVGPVYKRRLLAAARCLLAPSQVAETSSLVAMEALACGTPVVTFGAGALSEIVEHGRTGYIVADEDDMAAAIHRAHQIDPAECRRVAEARFDADRMARDYVQLYRRLLAGPAHRAAG